MSRNGKKRRQKRQVQREQITSLFQNRSVLKWYFFKKCLIVYSFLDNASRFARKFNQQQPEL